MAYAIKSILFLAVLMATMIAALMFTGCAAAPAQADPEFYVSPGSKYDEALEATAVVVIENRRLIEELRKDLQGALEAVVSDFDSINSNEDTLYKNIEDHEEKLDLLAAAIMALNERLEALERRANGGI
jgi:peptidoglycan hydrolase CwlO-like protein